LLFVQVTAGEKEGMKPFGSPMLAGFLWRRVNPHAASVAARGADAQPLSCIPEVRLTLFRWCRRPSLQFLDFLGAVL
jgi:hypothetical protein